MARANTVACSIGKTVSTRWAKLSTFRLMDYIPPHRPCRNPIYPRERIVALIRAYEAERTVRPAR